MHRIAGGVASVMIALGSLVTTPPAAMAQQGNEEMQKELNKLKEDTAQMQEKMGKLRQKLTELAQSGASAEEIQKAMEDLNKEFGFGHTPKRSEPDESGKAAKGKSEKPAEEHEPPKPQQPTVWLGFNGEAGDDGFEVTVFHKNSPAKKAGLRKGDVVVKFNGEEVTSAADIVQKELPVKPGDKATLTILRDGKEQTVEIVMEQRPAVLEAEEDDEDEDKDPPEDQKDDDPDMNKDHQGHDKDHEEKDDDGDDKD